MRALRRLGYVFITRPIFAAGLQAAAPARNLPMRRTAFLLITVCVAGLALLGATPSHAQHTGGPGGGGAGSDSDEDAKTQKRNEEWGTTSANLALPELRNAGPCPIVKVLYDASRYVELKDGRETPSAVAFSGEFEGLSAACEYKNDEPIRVQTRLLFGLGRGPEAVGNSKLYRYWVAVTDRNQEVIGKEYFNLPVTFASGTDRTLMTDKVYGIVIPRARATVSGSNFEVLVGFDVTPEMVAFNRDGKRFRPNATATTTTAANTDAAAKQ
jgi:hypothetical protein